MLAPLVFRPEEGSFRSLSQNFFRAGVFDFTPADVRVFNRVTLHLQRILKRFFIGARCRISLTNLLTIDLHEELNGRRISVKPFTASRKARLQFEKTVLPNPFATYQFKSEKAVP